MPRKPSYPLQQIVRRLGELRAERPDIGGPSDWSFNNEHCDGPLPPSGGPCRQFKCVKKVRILIGTDTSESSVIVDGNKELILSSSTR
ncbi:hypothetical protein SprV_0301161000 [Sparganum proliferum]